MGGYTHMGGIYTYGMDTHIWGGYTHLGWRHTYDRGIHTYGGDTHLLEGEGYTHILSGPVVPTTTVLVHMVNQNVLARFQSLAMAR